MKRKEKSASIFSYAMCLFVDQFIALMISLLVTNIVSLFLPRGGELLRFLICASLYCVIIYLEGWYRGSSDRNRIALGKIPDNKLKGFLAGLIASIPSFVLALLALLAEKGLVSVLDVFGKDITSVLNRFWNLPLGLLYNYANNEPYLNLLFPFFIPVVTAVGYVFGINKFSIKQHFLYKADKE